MLKLDTIDYHGIPLHLTIYETGADAPALIFIHGMSMHAGGYINTIPNANFLGALSEQGFTVIGLDLQGHGRSGGPRGLFTFHDLMGNISRAVDYAVSNYNNRVGITGSSMGGILSFYAAIEDGRIRSVVCHNTVDLRNIQPIFYLKRHMVILPIVRLLKPFTRFLTWLPIPIIAYIKLKDTFDKPGNIRFIIKDHLITRTYRFSSWISVFFNPIDKPAIEDAQTPVRIIEGEKDKIFSAGYIRGFYGRLRCPKDLVIIPGAGHMLLIEHMNIAVPLIAEWFKQTL